MENTHSLIQKACDLLHQGELVVIPTETVYGLAADAKCNEALQKIFVLKGRPTDHPLIVHLSKDADLSEWACDIPDMAYRLIDTFWPGPLTLILKKHRSISFLVTGGQESIGLRSPSHPLAQALLTQFGGGLAAPSANRFGRISPTTADHVRAEFKHNVPFILDGGPCRMGVESTILSLLDKDKPTLLRPGSLHIQEIEEVLKQTILYQPNETSQKIRVSGALESHYAPYTPLVLGEWAQLIEEISKYTDETLIVISHAGRSLSLNGLLIHHLTLPADAVGYAHNLYATLRQADQFGAKYIFIEKPPTNPEWLAIHDRLSRAAHIHLDK